VSQRLLRVQVQLLRRQWVPLDFVVPATKVHVLSCTRMGGQLCLVGHRVRDKGTRLAWPKLRPVCSAYLSTTLRSSKETHKQYRSEPAPSTHVPWRSAARPCMKRRKKYSIK